MLTETINKSYKKTPILILYTDQSERDEFNKFIYLMQSSDLFDCHILKSKNDALSALEVSDRYHIIIIHFHSQRDENVLWRQILYKARSKNKFSEIIVVVSDEDNTKRVEAQEVLSSGCFAFFQYEYEQEVLLGYIEAAKLKYEERRLRADFSQELNKATTVKTVSHIIVKFLKHLTNYDNITITLLKKSKNNQGYLRKLLYIEDETKLKWELLNPTINDPLIEQILSDKLKRRVFPNTETDKDIKQLFNKEQLTPWVKSWIALPLRHAEENENIGLITLDSSEPDCFSYAKVNEVALEQIANQAAIAIRYAQKVEAHNKLVTAINAINQLSDRTKILEKLAEQACELADGLFSYIVVPDPAGIYLKFEAAWSKDHKNNFIHILNNGKTFIHPFTQKRESGFLLEPYNKTEERKGITTIAFEQRDMQLLENIGSEKYLEVSIDARKEFFSFLYPRSSDGEISELRTASDIAIPIMVDTKVLGVINVEHLAPFAYTDEHINTLTSLADSAAIVINNSAENDLVKNLYESINFTPFEKIEDSLVDIAQKVQDASKAKYVSVFVVKDGKSFFIASTAASLPAEIKEGSRPSDPKVQGHTFWCVDNKFPVIINDTLVYQKSPSSYKDMYGRQYQRVDGTFIEINKYTKIDEVKALVCIPMMLPDNTVFGVIWMHHEVRPNYTNEHIKYFQIFANVAAKTLKEGENKKLREIESTIGNTQDKKSVLSEIVESAKVFFHVKGAAIYEADPINNKLIRVASNINKFQEEEIISYHEGLAGHLMLGIDKGGFNYSEGYVYVPSYTLKDYPHAMSYPDDRMVELGSVVGIRMPQNSLPEDAVGVLIVTDENRVYSQTEKDLRRLAEFAGKHLLYIKSIEKRKLSLEDSSVITPKVMTNKDAELSKLIIKNGWYIIIISFLNSLIILGFLSSYFFGEVLYLPIITASMVLSLTIGLFNRKLRKGRFFSVFVVGVIINIISTILTYLLRVN